MQTIGRVHSWLCQETHAWSGHFKNSHRCRHKISHSFGTRAMAVGGLVSFCDSTSHCSPGSTVRPLLMHCLGGSLLRHMIPSLRASCVRARTLGLSSSGKTFRVSRRLTRREVFYCFWRAASFASAFKSRDPRGTRGSLLGL